jgi:hypothetical protein
MMGKKAYTEPRLLYDGLGYFVALAGTFLSWLVAPHPTALGTAVNIMNTILFHQKNQVIQTSGYTPSIPELTL